VDHTALDAGGVVGWGTGVCCGAGGAVTGGLVTGGAVTVGLVVGGWVTGAVVAEGGRVG